MKRVEKRLVLKKSVKKFFYQVLYTVIVFLIAMILVKKNPEYKSFIKKNIYEKSFPFQKVHNLYEKYFGKLLSVGRDKEKTEAVFNEKLVYKNLEEEKDGLVKMTVEEQSPVSFLESGVIVYMGDVDNIGKTIVVEQVDGVEVSYSNVSSEKIKIYDYVEKGDLLGNVEGNTFYLRFQKDGKKIDYKKYL